MKIESQAKKLLSYIDIPCTLFKTLDSQSQFHAFSNNFISEELVGFSRHFPINFAATRLFFGAIEFPVGRLAVHLLFHYFYLSFPPILVTRSLHFESLYDAPG